MRALPFGAMRERSRPRRRGGAFRKAWFSDAQLDCYTPYVTLSEPPQRNGGEPNGSEQFHKLVICSLCCITYCIQLSTHLAQIPRLRSG